MHPKLPGFHRCIDWHQCHRSLHIRSETLMERRFTPASLTGLQVCNHTLNH